MMTKSAVAMLKKGDWHERGPVTDQGHDRSGKPVVCRDTSCVQLIKYTNNLVASFRIWSLRGCHQFYGRAQTYGSQSDV